MNVVISLGANLGSPETQLARARDAISELAGCRCVAQSSLYRTEPVDVSADNEHLSFLNAIVVIETSRSPEELMDALSDLERREGRMRGEQANAPRTLDLDMILAGEHVIESAGLTVPHPRWRSRRFVLQPLAEIGPDLRDPVTGRSVSDLLSELPERPGVELYKENW